jgi:DNA-binding NtrC family response regulator
VRIRMNSDDIPMSRRIRAIGENLERSYIVMMLDSEDWDIGKTAAKLRMSTETLKQKIEKYGITERRGS